jgi:hypothetical protein
MRGSSGVENNAIPKWILVAGYIKGLFSRDSSFNSVDIDNIDGI